MKHNKAKDVRIRVTESEKLVWNHAAKAAGVTLSNYIRELMNVTPVNRDPKETRTAKNYYPVDPDLVFQVSKIGNNLNQIARAVNRTGSDYSVEILEKLLIIERMIKQVQDAHKIS